MGILADRLQSIIDEMKRQDEELNKEIQHHVDKCHQLINAIDALNDE